MKKPRKISTRKYWFKRVHHPDDVYDYVSFTINDAILAKGSEASKGREPDYTYYNVSGWRSFLLHSNKLVKDGWLIKPVITALIGGLIGFALKALLSNGC